MAPRRALRRLASACTPQCVSVSARRRGLKNVSLNVALQDTSVDLFPLRQRVQGRAYGQVGEPVACPRGGECAVGERSPSARGWWKQELYVRDPGAP